MEKPFHGGYHAMSTVVRVQRMLRPYYLTVQDHSGKGGCPCDQFDSFSVIVVFHFVCPLSDKDKRLMEA